MALKKDESGGRGPLQQVLGYCLSSGISPFRSFDNHSLRPASNTYKSRGHYTVFGTFANQKLTRAFDTYSDNRENIWFLAL